MSVLAPTLQGFFTERLVRQRQASPATVASYRDSLRLLLGFVADRTAKAPSALGFDDLDAATITAFLCHLEDDRHNTARSRNNRLAAIRALFRYAALRHPEHAESIARVLAIPQKRHDKAIITFLTHTEAQALLAAPDRAAGKDAGTGPSSPSPSRPGCASPSSPASTAVTSPSAPGRTWPAPARAASSESCRSPPTPSPCCAPGHTNAPDSLPTRCSRPAPAAGSAPTPCNDESRSTSAPPAVDARRSPPRT